MELDHAVGQHNHGASHAAASAMGWHELVITTKDNKRHRKRSCIFATALVLIMQAGSALLFGETTNNQTWSLEIGGDAATTLKGTAEL
jgi:tetrahydromethanopterin S-methyltransferase subunit H